MKKMHKYQINETHLYAVFEQVDGISIYHWLILELKKSAFIIFTIRFIKKHNHRFPPPQKKKKKRNGNFWN